MRRAGRKRGENELLDVRNAESRKELSEGMLSRTMFKAQLYNLFQNASVKQVFSVRDV